MRTRNVSQHFIIPKTDWSQIIDQRTQEYVTSTFSLKGFKNDGTVEVRACCMLSLSDSLHVKHMKRNNISVLCCMLIYWWRVVWLRRSLSANFLGFQTHDLDGKKLSTPLLQKMNDMLVYKTNRSTKPSAPEWFLKEQQGFSLRCVLWSAFLLPATDFTHCLPLAPLHFMRSGICSFHSQNNRLLMF